MATFAERMIGAAKLEIPIYEEVEHDTNALGQAMGVVLLSAIASGVGALGAGPMGFLIGIVASLVSWFLWSGIIYLVGTRLMAEPQTSADLGQLLRTLGFAASPGLLNVLGVIPFFGWVVRFVVMIWLIIAMVVAVRQALDYSSTAKAVVVCLLGWLVTIAFATVLRLLGITAALL